jgi:Dolichyl-phosphate-mannose-protein mannosyltransferase
MPPPRLGNAKTLLLLVVLVVAGGARAWYVWNCADNAQSSGPVQVQESWPVLSDLPGRQGQKPPSELDALVGNLDEHHWFGSLAPLAGSEERTAHVSPGYPWLLHWLGRLPNLGSAERSMRWLQCGLGALTAAFYFLFALRAFRHWLIATLTGLFCALYPFWVFNTAELNDGVLASFLLAAGLFLGIRGVQTGEAFTGLLFGLALAALALVRAALLPFTIVALLWFLYRCRLIRRGWLCALVAFLGFANALAFWTFRNHKVVGDIVPIVDSAYLHLWMGNNSLATGGAQSEQTLVEALGIARGEDVKTVATRFAELPQKQRYDELGRETVHYVQYDPAGALRHRFEAAVCFLLGEQWLRNRTLWQSSDPQTGRLPDWLAGSYPAVLYGSLLAALFFGFLGWRWTYGWRHDAMLASLAMIWVPLPYLLSHAGMLSGPRLPLDGVLLCFTAFGLVCLFSPARRYLFAGGEPITETEVKPRG